MENANGELCELAILDKLAEMGKGLFLRLSDVLDHIEYSLDDSTLEIVPPFIAQNPGQKTKHRCVFFWEFEAERTDGIYDDNFEFIRNLAHEASDLLHQTVHGRFIAGL